MAVLIEELNDAKTLKKVLLAKSTSLKPRHADPLVSYFDSKDLHSRS